MSEKDQDIANVEAIKIAVQQHLEDQKCPNCGNPIKIIHHMTYKFNRNWKNSGKAGIDFFNLWEYSQFLIGFCSKKCHCKHHNKLNDNEEFVSLESVYSILKRKES